RDTRRLAVRRGDGGRRGERHPAHVRGGGLDPRVRVEVVGDPFPPRAGGDTPRGAPPDTRPPPPPSPHQGPPPTPPPPLARAASVRHALMARGRRGPAWASAQVLVARTSSPLPRPHSGPPSGGCRPAPLCGWVALNALTSAGSPARPTGLIALPHS